MDRWSELEAMFEALNSLVNRRAEPLDKDEKTLAWVTTGLLAFSLLFPFIVRYLLLGVFNFPKIQGNFAADIGMAPQSAAGILAIWLLYLAARPSFQALKVTLFFSALLEVWYFSNLPEFLTLYQKILSFGGGFGIAALGALAWQSLFDSEREARLRARIFLRMGTIVVLFPLTMGGLLGVLSNFTSVVYDGYGFVVEGCLGFLPSFEVAKFLALHPLIEGFFSAIYSRLPIFVMASLVLTLHFQSRCHFSLFTAYVISGILVFPFYYALPMVGLDDFLGPRYFPLGEIPDYTVPKPVQAEPIFPRSCIPSMHASSILMAYWSIKRVSSKLRWLYFFLVIGTLIAAVGPQVGHYSIDYVGAYPFTLGCVALASKGSGPVRRFAALCAGLGFGATLLFCLSVRWYGAELASFPFLTWSGMLGLVAATCLLESRLNELWRNSEVEPETLDSAS